MKPDDTGSTRVLGIDPGLRLTGYGCVEPVAGARGPRRLSASPATGISRDGSLRLVEGGVLRLDPKASVADRLVELERDMVGLLERLRPSVVAVEMLFAHVKHPATSIVMAHGRGVVLLAARRAGVEVVELRATEVKKAVTAFGHAGKGQVQARIQDEFALPAPPKPADTADALAIALCALRRRS